MNSLGGTATNSLRLVPDNLSESGSSNISVAAGNIDWVSGDFIEPGINGISNGFRNVGLGFIVEDVLSKRVVVGGSLNWVRSDDLGL